MVPTLPQPLSMNAQTKTNKRNSPVTEEHIHPVLIDSNPLCWAREVTEWWNDWHSLSPSGLSPSTHGEKVRDKKRKGRNLSPLVCSPCELLLVFLEH